MKKQSGITLVALVITIIIMLILAGVTISVIVNGGLFDQAKKAKELTQMEVAKEKVNALLAEYGVEKHIGGIEFLAFFDEKKTGREIDDVYENDGDETYTIEKDGYAVIVDKYTEAIASVEEITAEELTPRPELETTTVQFDKSYGVIEIVWLNASNKVINNPEKPVLGGLTPVKWTGTPGDYTEVTTTYSDTDWYSYTTQAGPTNTEGTSKWANAKAVNGTNVAYFVWIPRYAYRIVYFDTAANRDNYRNNSNSTTGIVGYSNTDGMVNLQLTPGTAKLVSGTEPSNVTGTVKTAGYEDYIPHPAFTFGTDSNKEKTGFWVGKYEPSGTVTTISIKPNVATLRSQTVSALFTAAQSIKTTYSLTGDTHMMKNIEWGAVAYLTDSRNGRNGTEIYINNSSSYITGNSGGSTNISSATGTTNAYNTSNGILASTTGNIYGIYDMSGGAWEYVMGALADVVNTTEPTIGSSEFTAGSFPDSKYYEIYNRGTTPEINTSNYAVNIGTKGDAKYETSTFGSSTNSWNSDYSEFVSASTPWFIYGGAYGSGSAAGIFSFHRNVGGTSGGSFRVTFSP